MGALGKAKKEMVEAGGRTAQSFGVSRLLGQLYMTLYLSDALRGLDDLAEELGVSKASISIACRQLESWGAVRRQWIKGDRKDYYQAVTDLGTIINNGLLDTLDKKLNSAQVQIAHCMNLLAEADDADPEQLVHMKNQLQEADKYRARIHGLLNNKLLRKMI